MPTEAELASVRAIAEQYRIELNRLTDKRAKTQRWIKTVNDPELVTQLKESAQQLATKIADLLEAIDGLGLELGLRGDVIIPRDLVFIRGTPVEEQVVVEAKPPVLNVTPYDERAKARDIVCAVLFHEKPVEELTEILGALTAHEQTWGELTPDLMKAIVGYLAARMHALQQDNDTKNRVGEIYRMLSRLQQTHNPGFVHGLKLDHNISGGNWHSESMDRWHRLAKLLEPLPALTANMQEKLDAVAVEVRNYGVAGDKPTKTKYIERIYNEARRAIRAGLVPTHQEFLVLLAPHFHGLPDALVTLVRF